MIVVIAIILPAALGRRSDPDVTPLPILSDWYFLGLYQMYKYLEPVVATEITMLIPISVILLPFFDSWITGAEKNIMKRPLILMTSIMGGLTWIVFSILIIINIANIHDDPPWWRASMYYLVDAGILWQLWLIWQESDLKKKAKFATGCLTMGFISFIQVIWAFWYYYMAKTEMFLSPLLHAFTYWACKVCIGANATTAEELVNKLVPKGAQMPYNVDLVPAIKERWMAKVEGWSGYGGTT